MLVVVVYMLDFEVNSVQYVHMMEQFICIKEWNQRVHYSSNDVYV